MIFLYHLYTGVAPCTNPDDHHQQYQVTSDRQEDRDSVKSFLISSYKKTLQPLIKDDIHKNNHDATPVVAGPHTSRGELKLINHQNYHMIYVI